MTNFGIRNIGVGQPQGSVIVTDESTEILPANLLRSSAFLVNLGKNNVWTACDQTAVVGVGPPIFSDGGPMSLDSTNLTLGPINGICESGRTSEVTFQELDK